MGHDLKGYKSFNPKHRHISSCGQAQNHYQKRNQNASAGFCQGQVVPKHASCFQNSHRYRRDHHQQSHLTHPSMPVWAKDFVHLLLLLLRIKFSSCCFLEEFTLLGPSSLEEFAFLEKLALGILELVSHPHLRPLHWPSFLQIARKTDDNFRR